jgi:hypothetical protein
MEIGEIHSDSLKFTSEQLSSLKFTLGSLFDLSIMACFTAIQT